MAYLDGTGVLLDFDAYEQGIGKVVALLLPRVPRSQVAAS